MKLKHNMVLTEVGEDVLAVPVDEDGTGFQGVVRLNQTAADIWRGLEAGLDGEQIAAGLTEQYKDLDMEHARTCTERMIRQLLEGGILE